MTDRRQASTLLDRRLRCVSTFMGIHAFTKGYRIVNLRRKMQALSQQFKAHNYATALVVILGPGQKPRWRACPSQFSPKLETLLKSSVSRDETSATPSSSYRCSALGISFHEHANDGITVPFLQHYGDAEPADEHAKSMTAVLLPSVFPRTSE